MSPPVKYAFLVNPAAGHGAAGRTFGRLERRLEEVGAPYVVHRAETSAALRAISAELEGNAERIVAVGGDGTVHDVVRGILGWASPPPLGILPLGTGNDFATMLGYGKNLNENLAALLNAEVAALDHGRVTWWEDEEGVAGEQPFVNAAGVGFDALVAVRAARLKFLPGSAAAYVGGVIGTLAGWRPPTVRIRDGREAGALYVGPMLLTSACNGRRVGGGFILAPGAELDDGLLDLCIVRSAPRGRILRLLPRAFTGTLETQPEVQVLRSQEIFLESDDPLALHADGEILSRRVRRLHVVVVPGALRVLVAVDSNT